MPTGRVDFICESRAGICLPVQNDLRIESSATLIEEDALESLSSLGRFVEVVLMLGANAKIGPNVIKAVSITVVCLTSHYEAMKINTALPDSRKSPPCIKGEPALRRIPIPADQVVFIFWVN